MRQLELKDIVGYFEHGLKIQTELGILELNQIILDSKWLFWANTIGDCENKDFNYDILTTNACCGRGFKASEIKPILYDISCLTEEIEVNGERFVPIIELSKLVDNGHSHYKSIIHKSSNYITVLTDKCDDIENVRFRFTIEGISAIERSGESVSIITYERIRAKLYEWKIDFKGLIPAGLAIDKKTLK